VVGASLLVGLVVALLLTGVLGSALCVSVPSAGADAPF
jgi:hypothetical protein